MSESKKVADDYRSRIYDRYVTYQLDTDAEQLQYSVKFGFPYHERMVSRYFPQDRSSSILDLGCGFGSLLHTLKKQGYTNLRGVETSAEQVQVANKLGLDCIESGDLIKAITESPAENYDVVVAFDVLEHFSKEEITGILDQIFRILKPSGMLVVHVPNGEAIFSGKIFFGDFTHQTAFTHRSITQIARCCGFSSIECHEDTPVVHGILSFFRYVLWKLVRFRYLLVNAIETGDMGSELILSQNLLAICRKSAAEKA